MPNRSTRDVIQGYTGPSTPTAAPPSDDPTDASGNREGDRRVASPPTRSAFGAASQSDPPPNASTPAPVSQGNDASNPTSDLSVLGAAQRVQARKAQINQAVDDAS